MRRVGGLYLPTFPILPNKITNVHAEIIGELRETPGLAGFEDGWMEQYRDNWEQFEPKNQ